MQHREYDYVALPNYEEDAVREAPKDSAAHTIPNNGKSLWSGFDVVKGNIELTKEFVAQASPLVVVPIYRFVDVRRCLNRESHGHGQLVLPILRSISSRLMVFSGFFSNWSSL